jgi:hypothetical protein
MSMLVSWSPLVHDLMELSEPRTCVGCMRGVYA